MEDPKRMRTKLRLDLKDVRRQIEDLEELLKEDKSPDNVEAHRKLVEYEKKLKDQYEKMTGLSVDQANKLEKKDVKVGKKDYSKSPFSGFLAMIGSLLIAWGYYNTVLHSIGDFTPTALVNYFSGTATSVSGLNVFMGSLLYESSFYLVTVPIGAGALLILLSAFLDSSRKKVFAILEGLGFLGTAGVFSFILFSSPDATAGVDMLVYNLMILSGAVIVAGLFIFIGSLGHQSIFRKLLGAIAGILFIYSGAQYLLLVLNGSADPELVHQWPWITVPMVIASGMYAFLGFLRIIK